MVNIILDTNILRKDRNFEKSDFLLLKKLAQLGLIKVHIPWIVYKEAISQNLIEIKEIIKKTRKEVRSLRKKGLHKRDHKKIDEIINQLNELENDVEKSVTDHWNEFIHIPNITVHEFDNELGKTVMDSYFAGLPPFTSPKSRKDIPDAFIFETVKNICKNSEQPVFISEDKNLRKAVDTLDNCKTFKSLKDYFESAEFKLIENKYKEIEQYADELIILNDNIQKIEEYAKEELYRDLFAGEDQVIEHENIPSDDNEGSIVDIENEKILNISIEKIQFINDVFYIPVEMEADFRIEYFLFKSDYYLYADFRDINIIDPDWNKHYYLVEELFKVRFKFKCKIEKEKVKNQIFEFSYEPAVIEKLEPYEK